MGFAYMGVCYSTAAEAQAAWKTQFPTVPDGAGLSWNLLSAAAPDSASSFFNATLWNAQGGTQAVRSFQFTGCTPLADFDPAVFAAFWMSSMLFVIGCWLFAKNAGVILSAIRRF